MLMLVYVYNIFMKGAIFMSNSNFIKNSNNSNNSTYIGTKIPENSEAIDLIGNQDCKSALVINLLSDFTKLNGPVRNYADIPQEERLRKFFHVPPSRKEIRQRIMAGISEMEKDKKLLAYLIEYVAFWVEYYRIFLPDLSFTCFISQFVIPSAKKLIETGLPVKGLEYAIMNAMESFGKQCRNVSDAAGRAQLEQREGSVGLAERIFILLAYQWACLSSSLTKDSGYSSEDAVYIVLDFMKEYLELDCYNDMFLVPLFTLFVEERIMKKVTV